MALLGGGPRTLNELEDKGISRAVLDNLCAKGVLECSKVNKSIDLYSSIPLEKRAHPPHGGAAGRSMTRCCPGWRTMQPRTRRCSTV